MHSRRLLIIRGIPAGFDLPFVRRFVDLFGRCRHIHHVDDQSGHLVPVVAISYDTADEAARACSLINGCRFLGIRAQVEGETEKYSRVQPQTECKLGALRAEYEKYAREQSAAEQLVESYIKNKN